MNFFYRGASAREDNQNASQSYGSSPARRTKTIRKGNSFPAEQETNAPIFLLGCKLILGAIFFLIVLFSSVLSKLTLVSLTDSLRHYSGILENNSKDVKDSEVKDVYEVAVLYWQLLLILLVPNILTFLRCLFFGALGKTRKSYPWPRWRAIILVS